MPESSMHQPFDDQKSIVDFLKKTRLFSPLSDELLWKLSPLLKYQQLNKSHPITREGEPNSKIFLLIQGQVALYTNGKLILKLRRGGDIFGEISVITNRPSIASEVAETDVLLFSIGVSDILDNDELNSSELQSFLFRLFSAILIDKLTLASSKAGQFEYTHHHDEPAETCLLDEEERNRMADQIKKEFLENINHEMRTPMHGIIGMTDLLLRTDLSPDQLEYACVIQESARALLAVINHLLDFSTIDTGKVSFSNSTFQLNHLINKVIQELGGKATEKDLALYALFGADIPELLSGDAVRLNQILMNLAGNAVKFTNEGEIVIRTQLEREQQNKVTIRFLITDTGIGIPAENMPRLFKSFSQVDGSLTRAYGGSGLGLAICKQLVDMMGGEIGVDSTEAKGSTFWFRLEFIKKSERRNDTTLLPNRRRLTRLTDPAKRLSAGDKAEKRILLVEDDRINRMVTTTILEKLGYQIHAVESGDKAMSELTGSNYDLILMDLKIPEMDGFEITRQIRNHDPYDFNPDIPIIALTANIIETDKQKCFDAGMDDYISKPIVADKLENILEQWLTIGESDLPSLDFAVLAQLRENVGDISNLVELFLNELPGKINRIKEAEAAADPIKIGRASHQLKSNCLTFGALKMVEICENLELIAETYEMQETEFLVQELINEGEKVREILKK